MRYSSQCWTPVLLGEREYIRQVGSNVFDTMNGHFWAVDASRPYVVIAKKRYGHSVKYQYSSAANYFRGTYKPYPFNNPGYVRCVRYADLKKWRRILAKKK